MMSIFPERMVHFGGDEIAGTWPDKDHRKTIENFENVFLLNLSKAFNKKPVIWEDTITEKKASISREFVIQVWRNRSNLSLVLNKGFQTIVSTSDTWYIGNATPEKISAFVFPYNSLIKGAELVWFTSEGDDPYDVSWLEPVIKAAGKKLI
jgi:hexosaminidase